MQELGHQHYASLSTSELTQTVTIPAVRGGIYDRNGEVLAESVTKQTVVADPLLITHPTTIAAALSPVLGIPTDQLRGELTEPSGFVYLAHRVPDAVAAKVTALNLAGINLVPEAQRVQPDGQLALPVVGTIGWNGNGMSGLEYQYQSMLAGRSGTEDLLESPGGVALPGNGNGSVAAQAGHRAGADHRRVGAVRRRAGPRGRDRRLPRLQRYRRGRGREDRGHPGHGRPAGHVGLGHDRGHRPGPGSAGARQAASRRRDPPWCRGPTPCPPAWRRRRPTPP